jgi:NAD(P)-dependent dehydrogenase (short-subunit alcohol dehydrogenase family)
MMRSVLVTGASKGIGAAIAARLGREGFAIAVHYRGGYIRSIGKVWYFTLEQIYDSRANLTGSQFGFSFSNP